jgi:hypothetical protein
MSCNFNVIKAEVIAVDKEKNVLTIGAYRELPIKQSCL